MANQLTKIMSDSERDELLNKAKDRKSPSHSKKPIAKNMRNQGKESDHGQRMADEEISVLEKTADAVKELIGQLKDSIAQGNGEFSQRNSKVGQIDYLKENVLNAILRNHRVEGQPLLSIGENIGEGGFSVVYSLRQSDGSIYDDLALKVTDPFMAFRYQHKGSNLKDTLAELCEDQKFLNICAHIDTECMINRIIQEKKLKYCVPFYEDLSFIDDSVRFHMSFMVMSRMDGSIQERPKQIGDSLENWQIAHKMLAEVLESLQFLSEHNGDRNIFSRDIKPANILYRYRNGEIHFYLSDFGMSSIGESYSNHTRFMTPGYTAPETEKDIRSDLFSLGRTAFYICNGYSLGETDHSISKRFHDEQEMEATYWDNTPEELRAIIQKSVSPNPEDRYESATEMLKEVLTLNFQKRQEIMGRAKTEMATNLGRQELRHQEEIHKLEQKIDELKNSEASFNEQINGLNEQISAKDNEIRRFRNELAQTRQKNNLLQAALDNGDATNEGLTIQVSQLGEKLKEKEKEIKQKQQKIEQLEKLHPQLQQLQEENSELKTERENLKSQIDALRTQVQNLQSVNGNPQGQKRVNRQASTQMKQSIIPPIFVPYDRFESIRKAKEKDIVTFGRYPQNGSASESIEWIVLERNGKGMLLISRYALDCKPYNTKHEAVTWEICTLRAWLNNTFYQMAFTGEEKGIIQVSQLKNEDNPEYGTEGGKDTNDKVFLLSLEEAKRYFPNDEARRCKPTANAVANDAFDFMIGICLWWLRSPGDNSRSAADVSIDGSVDASGCFVNDDFVGVRPALRINL